MNTRVLYVIDSLAPGGAETSLAELAAPLIQRGIELHVLPLGVRRDLAERLESAGVVVHPQPSRRGRLANVNAVLSACRQVRPDLVHTTLFEADVAGRTAARLLSVRSSTSLVNDSYGRSHYAEISTLKLTAARGVDSMTARFATRFHAITQAIAESVPPRIGVPTNKVEVIPRGRDPLAYPLRTLEATRRARAELDLPQDAPIVLAIGRLEPQKGLLQLLDALPELARDHQGIVTLIAGKDGRAAESLRRTASASGLDVRFLGHRKDVVRLLTAADVFCFPSEREGFGGVLIEAMAVGCPVVATSIPTSREVLGEGPTGTGALVPVGDRRALARALAQTLSGDGVALGRAATARSRFTALFSIDTVASQMAGFFEGVASGTRVRREDRV